MEADHKARILRVLRKHRKDVIALKLDFIERYGDCPAVRYLNEEIVQTEDTIFEVQKLSTDTRGPQVSQWGKEVTK